MIDVATLSAYGLLKLCEPTWNGDKSEKPKIFLKELSVQIASLAEIRKNCLIDFKPGNLSYGRPTMPTIQVSNAKRRCEACKTNPATKDNKTTAVYDICRKPCCSNHYIRACQSCYLRYFGNPSGSDEGSDDLDEDDRQ
ncbi:unnamed protein product [Hermetia illucens]|uniref:Uncharacterized protein n=1 Tax=Hermetia illucens TaxID=343691 RepID=A0A7R8UM83_HERIL|nr:unnamed protein product [Hermetia illucens]